MRSKQQGFSAVEAVIIVLVIAAIGVVGYTVYNRKHNAKAEPSASQQRVNGTTPVAPAIEDTSDLDSATKTLDDTNIDATASDSRQLDSEINRF